MFPLAGFQVLSLTDRAAERVLELTGDSDAIGLRIGIKNGGCAGMSYTLEKAFEAVPGEDTVEHNGARVMVEPKAVLFLLGTEMDFEVTKLRSGFVFNNPNQTSACGCGESVALAPAAMPHPGS